MYKVLALSALLANSNAKASAITSATASDFNTSDDAVPTYGGGMTESQKPNADPQFP